MCFSPLAETVVMKCVTNIINIRDFSQFSWILAPFLTYCTFVCTVSTPRSGLRGQRAGASNVNVSVSRFELLTWRRIPSTPGRFQTVERSNEA